MTEMMIYYYFVFLFRIKTCFINKLNTNHLTAVVITSCNKQISFYFLTQGSKQLSKYLFFRFFHILVKGFVIVTREL